MSQAFHAKGSTFSYGSPLVAIPEILKMSLPDIKSDRVEVTNLNTVGGFKEYVLTWKDGGEITVDCNFVPGNAAQQGLRTAAINQTLTAFQIAIPSPNTQTVTFNGYVSGFKVDLDTAAQAKVSITVLCSGAPVVT